MLNPQTDHSSKPKISTGMRFIWIVLGVLSSVFFLLSSGEVFLRYINNFGLDDFTERNRYYDTLKVGRYVIRNRNNTHGKFAGVQVDINALGFRGEQANTHKKSGVYRILMLGDEKTFGWRIPEEKTYSARLQTLLDEHFIGKFEVLNGGVPGYDLPQMADYISRFALQYRPDVICMLLGTDDVIGNLEPKNLEETFNHGLLKTSYLARYLYCSFIYQPHLIPDKKIQEEARRSIRKIESLTMKAGIPLIIILWTTSDDEMRPEAARAMPHPKMLVHAIVIDSEPLMTTLRPKHARVGLIGGYPSERAHQLLAQLHLGAIALKSPNFIFVLRDGKSIPRNLLLNGGNEDNNE